MKVRQQQQCFHGFANLTTTRGEGVFSPRFSCFGHQWRLYIYPGGRDNSNEGYVAVALANRSNSDTSIKISYGYSVRDSDGKEVVHHELQTNVFAAAGCQAPPHSCWCFSDFAKRSKIMDALVQGSLVVEVQMKLPSTGTNIRFIPTNPFNKNVLKLFNEEESADVVFEVGGEQATGTTTRKKSKTTTNFHAHRILLKNNASALCEMCRVSGEGGIATDRVRMCHLVFSST